MSEGSSPAPELVFVGPKPVEAFGALGDLELEFEKAEIEVLKYQIKTTAPLYERRNPLTSQIPGFWPTVLEATPDFDQHVTPKDVPAFATITSLNIIRPNPEEPRDFIIEIGFDKERNQWFEDEVIRKQFWWRGVEGVWSGLVSEPVEVRWKDNKDLSDGETRRVYEEWKAKKEEKEGKGKGKGKATSSKGKGKGKETTTSTKSGGEEKKKEKKASLEERLKGGQPSFFTWFAWVGRGTEWGIDGNPVEDVEKEDEDEDEDEDDQGNDLFNHGDELALTIADDIYPNAIKYFLETITGQGEFDSDMSVSDLDSDEGDEEEEEEEEEDNEDDGIGSSRTKRFGATVESDEEDEEDGGNKRRKRVKK
ncbi:hypothetical protein TWF679_008703 [Orbilia oligospora]|uniref:Uncharacterized protein n=1 Tax=Orbilia oligospora TaxID=2813651 RepID=A0A8H8V4J7_ORBOL|nr:hypothetical protein TWF679_008703 [Orbilia oligospora]